MRPLLRVSLLLFSMLLPGCSDELVEPGRETPAGNGPLVLDAKEITLTSMGDSAVVRVTAGKQSTDAPTLSQAEELRWLGDRAVLDSEALARGRLLASAPGRVRLRVSAFGLAPVDLLVHVRPNEPAVLTAVQRGPAGDTLEVHGFRLDAVPSDSYRIPGASLSLLSRDSAVARFVLSATASDCSGSARPALAVTGARVYGEHRVRIARPNEISLQAGEVLRLPAGGAKCVQLAPAQDARYALVFVDARRVRASASGPLEPYQGEPEFRANIENRTGLLPGAAASLRLSRSRSLAPPALQDAHQMVLPEAQAGGDSVWPSEPYHPVNRDRPWTLGESFRVRKKGVGFTSQDWEEAKVVRIYGGHYVVALRPGVSHAEEMLRALDVAVPQFIQHGEPFYAGLVPMRPRLLTSAGSGQMLVLIEKMEYGALIGGYGEWAYIAIADKEYWSPRTILKTFAHELGHAAQQVHTSHVRPAGADPTHGGLDQWASEGVADFLAYETIRRAHQIPLTGNVEWRSGVVQASSYLALPASGTLRFSEGYASAAGFLTHLAARLASERGLTPDSAVRVVARGAFEGWYGYDYSFWTDKYRRRGLVDRMQEATGAAWVPEQALLQWALSGAGDDLHPNKALHDPTFLRMFGYHDRANDMGHTPHAIIQANLAEGAALNHPHGSPGYVLIADDNLGGSFRASANIPGVEWALLRLQ